MYLLANRAIETPMTLDSTDDDKSNRAKYLHPKKTPSLETPQFVIRHWTLHFRCPISTLHIIPSIEVYGRGTYDLCRYSTPEDLHSARL